MKKEKGEKGGRRGQAELKSELEPGPSLPLEGRTHILQLLILSN